MAVQRAHLQPESACLCRTLHKPIEELAITGIR